MNRRRLLGMIAGTPLSALLGRAQVGTTIDEIEVFHLKVSERGNWIVVRLRTNHRLYGIGEASHSGNDATVLQLLKEYFERLRGNSPFQVEPFRKLLLDNVQQSGRAGAAAFSALEQALYDLQGRVLGVPSYALFGGLIHERIRCYANINRAGIHRTPQDFVEQATRAVKAGFTAIKMGPFEGMPRNDPAKATAQTEMGIECIARVRKAVGPKVFLLVDGGFHFDNEQALELAAKLEPFDLGWFEEPTQSVEGLAEVNSAAKMPIAGGDSLHGVQGFFRFLDARAVDIVTPDIKQCGGMLELKKIAAMVEGAGLLVAPHGPAGPVGSVAAAHVCATLGNFALLEYSFGEVPWRASLINPPERLENGSLVLAESPGFGVRLNEQVALKYAV